MDKFDKAIASLQNIVEYWAYRPSEVEAAKLAITALKQQQEREQGCEYCAREKVIQIKFEGDEAGRAWMHKCSDGYGLFLEGEIITYIEVEYCPMCGRDLRKVVAE